VQTVKRGGAHKVLFGTEGPWLHPALELQKIRLLGLPPQEEALVLGNNLLRLIKGVRTSQHKRVEEIHNSRKAIPAIALNF
jgi:hypothetical protein